MKLHFYKEFGFWGLKAEDNSIYLPANYNDLTVFITDNNRQVLDYFNCHSPRKKGMHNMIAVPSETSIFFLSQKKEKWSLLSKRDQSEDANDLIHHFQEYPQFEIKNKYTEHLPKKTGRFYKDIAYIGHGLFKVKIIEIYRVYSLTNEEGDMSGQNKYDKFHWILIDVTGERVSQEKYQDILSFRGDLCKIKIQGIWNFITPNVEYASDNWFSELDYPMFDNTKFLASKLKYAISYTLLNKYTVFKKIEHFELDYDNDITVFGNNTVDDNGIKGEDKIRFSGKELEYLITKVLGSETIITEIKEIVDLDIYDMKGLVKRIGIKELSIIQYEDDDFVENACVYKATVNSIFIADYTGVLKIKKLYRNIDSKIINGVNGEDLWIYEFDQQRLVNKDWDFVGSNYYHEIFEFSNGLAKVSKSYFLGDNDLKIDTSANEMEFTGTIELSNPKYGFIDKNGEEIVDCKYECLNDFKYNKCPFELKINGKIVTGFLDNEYKEHFE